MRLHRAGFDDVLRYGGRQPFLDPAQFGRHAGRINGTTGRFSMTSDADLDGWIDQTYLVRMRPAASLVTDGIFLAKVHITTFNGFMIRHTTGGNIRADQDWTTVNATYITNDAPLVPEQWVDVVLVIRAGGSLSIYAAPLGAPLVERSYGTATDGTGTFNSGAAAENLIVGNRTTAATVAFEGDYALAVAIERALTDQEVRELSADPRAFLDDPDCWVWAVIGHTKFASASPSGMNLAGNALRANVARLGTGGGAVVGAPGPYPNKGGLDHLRRYWPVGEVVAGSALVSVRTETVEAAEAPRRTLGLVRLRTETVEVAEGKLSLRGLLRLVTETVQVAEGRLSIRGLVRLRTETVDVAEGKLSLRGLVRIRTEVAQVSETVLRRLGLTRIRTEGVNVAETLVRRMGLVRIRADGVQVAEGFLRRLGLLRIRTEQVQASESRLGIRGLIRLRTETVQVAETKLGLVSVATQQVYRATLRLGALLIAGAVRYRALLTGGPDQDPNQ